MGGGVGVGTLTVRSEVTMPRTHKLVQTWNATTEALEFQFEKGDGVDTDRMSECTSVVVLCGWSDQEQRFTRAVGQHGGGGIGNVNVEDILRRVGLNNRGSMQVLIVSDHTALGESYHSMNNTAIRKAKRRFVNEGFRMVRTFWGQSGAVIKDTGDVEKY
jgi:hypothetical protein